MNNQQRMDAQPIIDKLLQRISSLVMENTMLAVQLESMQRETVTYEDVESSDKDGCG
jgi:hypothetical protein